MPIFELNNVILNWIFSWPWWWFLLYAPAALLVFWLTMDILIKTNNMVKTFGSFILGLFGIVLLFIVCFPVK